MNSEVVLSLPNPPTFDELASAESLFDSLREISRAGIGVTRESYGTSEETAIRLVEMVAERNGLQTERDDAANLFVTLPGAASDGSFVLCGSHLDSVPCGGNYDGAAGVVAGLICLCKMKSLGIAPRRTIKLVALRAEESASFGKPCLGSSALLGRLSPEDFSLKNSVTGKTLKESIQLAGAQMDRLPSSRPLLDIT